MRRLLVFIMASSLLAFALPASTANAVQPRYTVRGTGVHKGVDYPYPAITVRIRAGVNADGSHPRGVVIARSNDQNSHERGQVVCMAFWGDRLTIGIKIVKSETPSNVGKGQFFNLVKTEEGELIAGYPLTDEPPTDCPQQGFGVPVISGGYFITGPIDPIN
jgi:hypothetical protein